MHDKPACSYSAPQFDVPENRHHHAYTIVYRYVHYRALNPKNDVQHHPQISCEYDSIKLIS